MASDDNRARKGTPPKIEVLPTPPRIDLKSIDNVRLEMARVYREMKARQMEAQEGTRLVYVLSQIGKMIEIGEIEKRLDALEARQLTDQRRA